MAPKNYTVSQFVKNTAGDIAEVEKIIRENPHFTKRAARDLLARRRFCKAINELAK
jgi:hypothetical protein